jgi:CBS domain-containing protein
MNTSRMNTDLRVRDIMTKEVVSADVNTPLHEIASLMVKYDVGSVVMTEGGEPVGIITERDFARKVIPKNKKPEEFSARDVMSSPIITIAPDETLNDAIEKMIRMKVRRLPVVEDGHLVGIITDMDIIHVSAGLTEVLRELIEMQSSPIYLAVEEEEEMGVCEMCGQLSADLKLVDGKLMCESCRE